MVSVFVFYVNGKKIVDENVNPEWTLLYYLRTKLALCGTKLGCGEGGCGACTVMVSKYDEHTDKISHFPVNACLAPICSMHGLAVTTVEGIGSNRKKLHPVQERIAKAHGSQCGFCTPGIVMSMYTLLRNCGDKKPTMEGMATAFQGNLCRCTGYRPIIEGYKTFTHDWERGQLRNGGACVMGEQCCQFKPNNLKNGRNEEKEEAAEEEQRMLYDSKAFVPHDPTQEPIFPPELKLNRKYDQESLCFQSQNVLWYRPRNLKELVELKEKHACAKIVVGNTEIGVEVKFRNVIYPVLIQPTMVKEMTRITMGANGVIIGAAVTLQHIQDYFMEITQTLPEFKTKIFAAVVEMLHWFGNQQIRCVASIGGNIMNGSPISDLNPIWMAARAKLIISSASTNRMVIMNESFFTGYRQTVLADDEILVSIEVPFTESNQYFWAQRQARRRDDAIAIVNAAINIHFRKADDLKITDLEMAFGGMGPITLLAKCSKQLIGKCWNRQLLSEANHILMEEFQLTANAPGGMIDYRRALVTSFFFRCFLKICHQLGVPLQMDEASAIDGFTYKPTQSSQYYNLPEDHTRRRTDNVGRPVVAINAYNQASGEAIYIDDMPKFEKELSLALIFSKKAHAKIISVDVSEALKMENVVDCILAEDIPEGQNVTGICLDEEYIRSKIVTSQYQVLGGILATDQMSARRAANAVKVKYEPIQPVIVTIEQAIELNSFFETTLQIDTGKVTEVMQKSEFVVHGEARTGYQEHFYLEPQSFLALPKEGEELEVYAATQDHTGTSSFISKLLNIGQHKVAIKVKRIGGGFGGKETLGYKLAAYAALAAVKTKRPVRLVLDRDEDMGATGGRNPFLVRYKLGFQKTGRINAADIEIYINAGHSYDMSHLVLGHALSHVTNSMKFGEVRARGKLCKTNLPTNTSFRGFGCPQIMFAAECMVRDVAEFLKIDYLNVARINFLQEGDITHYNQQIVGNNLGRCFEECLKNADYVQRKLAVEQFNKENRWKKRGIDVVTTTYGVGFGANDYQQAAALLHVYQDGTILLTHGGVEMGQGLHTKMIQVASKALGVDMAKIHTSEVSTDKVPNTITTAASVSSDLNGMAVIDACNKILHRLEPLKIAHPKDSWEELISMAHTQRISLSATGFYCEPEINWDWKTGTGNRMYNYFTFGAACSEVEVDCLTGDHQVLRTDIVMDLGNSLNPAIDIGQIEGGFMQGYGMFTLEEMVTSPEGAYLTKGPGSYKIPSFQDIPIEFNVSLLKGSSNPRAVYASKAIGEPPLFLASSVLFAIREAVKAARRENGAKCENFRLNAPATADRICMAMNDTVASVASSWCVDYL